jgi:hypothetical protein
MIKPEPSNRLIDGSNSSLIFSYYIWSYLNTSKHVVINVYIENRQIYFCSNSTVGKGKTNIKNPLIQIFCFSSPFRKYQNATLPVNNLYK